MDDLSQLVRSVGVACHGVVLEAGGHSLIPS
jgi:hypothetical protein